MDYSWRRFQIMVGDEYGVRWLPTYVRRRPAPDPSEPMAPLSPQRAQPVARRASVPARADVRSTTRCMSKRRAILAQLVARPARAPAARSECAASPTPADIAALAREAGVQLHRPRRARAVRRQELTPIRGQLGDAPAAAGGALRLHRRLGLHVPARRRHPARRHVRARRVVDAMPEPATIAGIVESHRQRVRRFPLPRLNCSGAATI